MSLQIKSTLNNDLQGFVKKIKSVCIAVKVPRAIKPY